MIDIQQILTLAGTAVPLLAGLLTFLLKFVKNERAKRILGDALKITEVLQPLIVKAEEFSHYTGAEKKQFVLTYANQLALQSKIKFDEEKTAALIDELVETTKRVNAREKDKAVTGIVASKVVL